METNIQEQTVQQVDLARDLPPRKIHETPRLLLADAYTAGSDLFQSKYAKEKSVYYITFRRRLEEINPSLYAKDDNRIVFVGLGLILEKLFYVPVTHSEIDETLRFMETAKATTTGVTKYQFNEEMWRTVVDEYNGRPPIKIDAMPEGSVVYPNEPIVQITCDAKNQNMGELAAWFESKLLQTYAISERVTQDRHFFSKMKDMVRTVDPNLSDAEVNFFAGLMVTDFGDRAGFNLEESQELGMAHFYTWLGSDTLSGAYQAWKNSDGKLGVGVSVNALAHRNVQAYEFEGDCYEAIYNAAEKGEIISMVSDCYDFYNAVPTYLLPLAKRSVTEETGKVVVARPDSGNAKEQVLYVCRLAVENGLYTTRTINGKEWKFATTLKFIEGDGMTFSAMLEIIDALMEEGFAPYSWGLFGVGGGLRNALKRDNLSAKYALCAMGLGDIPVCKFSETLGKTTLPGPFKVLRTPEALATCKTIVSITEEGENAMVNFFNGENIYKPFGPGQYESMYDQKIRIDEQFDSMPKTLETEDNHNYPASELILNTRIELLKKYAPNKDVANY